MPVLNQNYVKNFEALISEDVPLAKYTNLGIGGPARYFAEISSADSLIAGIEWAERNNQPVFILGGGSNIVVADSGFPGLVVRPMILGTQSHKFDDVVKVVVGSGENWDSFVADCVRDNLAGVECMSGIPGSVGATPIQNVGAYGQEISETVIEVQAVDTTTRQVLTINSNDCQFGYRTSRFKTIDRDRFIITGVTYRLKLNGPPTIRYAELQRYLSSQNKNQPTLAEVRHAIIEIRRRKAMVVDPTDPDSRSCGSFFMNPIVTPSDFEKIKQRAQRHAPKGAEMPSFPAGENIKLSAAWLIENSGFHKGFIFGNVGTSTKHSLALINRGGGMAAEIKKLSEMIISEVKQRFCVTLIPEPVFVGCDD